MQHNVYPAAIQAGWRTDWVQPWGGLGGAGGWEAQLARQLALTAQKANRALGCSKSSVASGAREGIVPLCSALVRPHLQCCARLWGPQHKKDMDLLERAQRRPWRWSEGWSTCEDRLRELGLFRLEKRRLQGDLIAACQYLTGPTRKLEGGFLQGHIVTRTRGNGFKLKEGRFRLDVRKKFFTVRVVRCWHRLPRAAVDAPSLAVLKARLDGAWSNLL